MNYIDLDGRPVTNKSGQDRLLGLLYQNTWGRILLKPLVMPVVSKLGAVVLSSHLSACFVEKFVDKNGIDMKEYESRKFRSFNDFFTRKICEGRRPVDQDCAMVSPSDGKVTVYPVTDSLRINVKHTVYTLEELLKNKNLASAFEGGYVYIVRLCVDDYHRYIYPVSGSKSRNHPIKGVFHTVNPVANDYYPIYKENSREYTLIRTRRDGDVLMMEVGALMVGKITNLHQKRVVQRGEEKGYFEFGGSTIMIITDRKMEEPRRDLIDNTLNGYETKVLQGQPLTKC